MSHVYYYYLAVHPQRRNRTWELPLSTPQKSWRVSCSTLQLSNSGPPKGPPGFCMLITSTACKLQSCTIFAIEVFINMHESTMIIKFCWLYIRHNSFIELYLVHSVLAQQKLSTTILSYNLYIASLVWVVWLSSNQLEVDIIIVMESLVQLNIYTYTQLMYLQPQHRDQFHCWPVNMIRKQVMNSILSLSLSLSHTCTLYTH